MNFNIDQLNVFLKQIEALTPGGSEFHNNPQRCIDFISKAPKMVVKKQIELKALRAEIRRLKTEAKIKDEILENRKIEIDLLTKEVERLCR